MGTQPQLPNFAQFLVLMLNRSFKHVILLPMRAQEPSSPGESIGLRRIETRAHAFPHRACDGLPPEP